MMTDQITVVGAPTIEDATVDDLMRDPYPTYRRARQTAAVVNISAIKMPLVTHFDDILAIERDPTTFSSDIPESNVVKLFGPNLMRKDGDAHRRERKALDKNLRPGPAKRCWEPRLAQIVDEVIASIEEDGATDLFATVAEPIAGRVLAELVGFVDVDWDVVARWSKAMMEGSGNYAGDPEPRRLALAAGKEIEAAVDSSLDRPGGPPESSMLHSMLDGGLDRSEMYGNAKVAVGGGFNEPRDSLLSLMLGLLTAPDQLAHVMKDDADWGNAFEEAVRWISPIGMYPRKVTRDVELGGIFVPRGTILGLSVAAANHEPTRFENPEVFDVRRPKRQNLAFGSGPHFCAGTWIARMLVGDIAAPRLVRRLRNLRLSARNPVEVRGWVFRGPTKFLVEWDA